MAFISVNPFFVYCGAIIDIGNNISAHMEMIGIVTRIGTIRIGLETNTFLCYNERKDAKGGFIEYESFTGYLF